MIKTKAPGKMILLGEYAVLEGSPALVCSVNRYAHVSIEKSKLPHSVIKAPSIGVSAEPFILTEKGNVRFNPTLKTFLKRRLSLFAGVFSAINQSLSPKRRLPNLVIEIDTSEFYSQAYRTKFGFGSSAALTVAFAKAIAQYLLENDFMMEKSTIFNLALKAHREAQGKIGSGIDIAASMYQNLLLYKLSKNTTEYQEPPLKIPKNNNLIMNAVWAGYSTSTVEMIGNVQRLKNENISLYNETMNALKKTSILGIEYYKEKDKTELFLEMVNQFYDQLFLLGQRSASPIISESHQKISKLVRACGGAYKPSGAGGGDIGVYFCNSDKMNNSIKTHLKNEGIHRLNI